MVIKYLFGLFELLGHWFNTQSHTDRLPVGEIVDIRSEAIVELRDQSRVECLPTRLSVKLLWPMCLHQNTETLELVMGRLPRVVLESEVSVVSEEIVDRPFDCGYLFTFRRRRWCCMSLCGLRLFLFLLCCLEP
jgi:hypothetical protein